MKSGIYTVTCFANGKILVGQSINAKARLRHHLCKLNSNTHDNPVLQKAFNKYGSEYFLFELLEEVALEFLLSQENYWCNMLDTHNRKRGFNLKPTFPFAYSTHSAETKLKISIGNKGKKLSKETRQKLSDFNKGKILTIEHKQKIGISSKGRKHSEETKKKMSFLKVGVCLARSEKGEENRKKAHNKWLLDSKILTPIQDNFSGNIYSSLRECQRKTGLSGTAIRNNIKGKGALTQKYQLIYVRTA